MIWLALLVPLLGVVIMAWKFPGRLTWWEPLLPIAAALLVIGVGKGCGEAIAVHDVEYWGGWVTEAVYYEPWDERVPCSHARYRTETRYSTDSKGRTTSYTVQVFDGWMHSYDVDDHPAHWVVEDSNGFGTEISQEYFESFARKFKSREFRELNRDYHSLDGDAYVATWPADWDTLTPYTTVHSYTNRVQQAGSIHHWRTVNPKKSKVYEYQDQGPFRTPSVLPATLPGAEELTKLNAQLGAKKKIRIWLLTWVDTDRQIAVDQQHYWKGSNKNELVICVGLGKDQQTVQWCEVFSWSKSEDLKQAVKSYLAVDEQKLNIPTFVEWLRPQIEQKWQKRNWHDFDYLSIDLPTWAVWTTWIVVILTTMGTCAWAVLNEEMYDDEKR